MVLCRQRVPSCPRYAKGNLVVQDMQRVPIVQDLQRVPSGPRHAPVPSGFGQGQARFLIG